jgi:hypothetical protein
VLRRTNNRVELWTEVARNQRHEDVLAELTLSRHVVFEVALKLPDLEDRFSGQSGSMTSGIHMEETVDKAERTEVKVDAWLRLFYDELASAIIVPESEAHGVVRNGLKEGR